MKRDVLQEIAINKARVQKLRESFLSVTWTLHTQVLGYVEWITSKDSQNICDISTFLS